MTRLGRDEEELEEIDDDEDDKVSEGGEGFSLLGINFRFFFLEELAGAAAGCGQGARSSSSERAV